MKLDANEIKEFRVFNRRVNTRERGGIELDLAGTSLLPSLSLLSHSLPSFPPSLSPLYQLQNEKKRLKSDFDTLSFQSKIMKQDLDSSTQRIESFEKEIQQLMNEKSQLQSTNSHLNSEMNQLNTTMRVIQSEKEGLNQRILILQKENQRYSEESRQYLAAKSLQEHKIMELQHQLDSERARALEMSDRVGVGVGAGAGAGPTLLSTRSVDSLTTADGLGLGSGSSQLLQELQTLRYTLQRNESELSKNQYALSDARAVNDDLRVLLVILSSSLTPCSRNYQEQN